MRICIPTNGESKVFGHFGSAPYFYIYDSETSATELVSNNNSSHEHGNCNPIQAIGAHNVNAVVVGGMGQRALLGLNNLGIKVFRAENMASVSQVLQDFHSGNLRIMTMEDSCREHGHHEH